MRSRHCFRVLSLTALGAVPGVALALWAESWSFLGIALIGGLMGLGLGLSSLLYRTTLRASLRRVVKGFAHVMLEYNLGGWVADRAVTFEREPAAEELQPDTPAPEEYTKPYWRRFHAGFLWGMVLFACLGFGLGWKYADTLDATKPTPAWMGGLLVGMIAGVLGLVYGTALAVLTVPGRHRVRILAGAAVGGLLGVGLVIATAPGAKDPVSFACFGILLFTTLGTACGLFAPESLPPAGEDYGR